MISAIKNPSNQTTNDRIASAYLKHLKLFKNVEERALTNLPSGINLLKTFIQSWEISTSSSISFHIKRAYLQTNIWLYAPFVKSISILPLEYGYEKDDDEEADQEGVIPIVTNFALSENFPKPFKCLKCARDNSCICRAKWLKCCEYCGCKPDECKNPNSIHLVLIVLYKLFSDTSLVNSFSIILNNKSIYFKVNAIRFHTEYIPSNNKKKGKIAIFYSFNIFSRFLI